MRRIISVAAAGLMFVGIAACNQATMDKIHAVQQVAEQVCGFLPVAESVVNIFNAGGTAMTVTAAADAICKAVADIKTETHHRGVETDANKSVTGHIVINGHDVEVKGTFVK